MAASVGIANRPAAKIARTYGLPVRKRGALKGEKGVPLPLRAAALRMVADGATLAYAGAQVGASRQRVFQWAKEAGVVVGKGRKGKTKTAVRETGKPAQPGQDGGGARRDSGQGGRG